MSRAAHLRSYRNDWFGLTIVVAMLVWFCDGMIFEGKVPFFRDLGTYTFPLKFSLAKSFQAGELPLWDRHIAAGFPLLAAFQPGAFYPLSFVYLIFSFFDAVRITFFLHYLIAASGAYLLCRWWKYPTHVAIIGATLFTFGGEIVSLSNLLNHFQSAVWLPWMILCWERMLRSQTWTKFVLLALVLYCALLAGSPEIYLMSMLLLIADGLRLVGKKQIGMIAKAMGLLFASNLLVAALGMAQFLPTVELLSNSRREHPIPLQEATAWSLSPTSLVGLFFPDKEIDANLPSGVRLFFTTEMPFLLSHYLGILSLVGIGFWYRVASWKGRGIALLLLSASLFLAFGNFTPVYGYLIDLLPVIRAIRFPEKYFFLTYALLVFLILRGFVALQDAGESGNRFPVDMVACILIFWVGLYGVLRADPQLLLRLSAQQPGDVSGTASTVTTHAAILFHLERQIAITVAVLVVFICQWKKLLASTSFQVCIVAIGIFDLGLVHKPFQFLLEPTANTKSKLVSLPTFRAEGYRLFYYPPGANLHPSFVSVLGRPHFAKATALNSENLLPNTGVIDGFDYFQEIDALARQPYNNFLDFANLVPVDSRIKLLRALNVRYVVSFRELIANELSLYGYFPEYYSWVYEVKDPVPRVYVVSNALQETQPAKIIRILSSKTFDPATTVIIDQPVTTRGRADRGRSARIVHYGNKSVTIQTSAKDAGILVLADAYYPGWKVFVDGRESTILRANYFFRGVALGPGEHNVKFDYQPSSFVWGLRISVIAVSMVFLVSVALSVGQRNWLRPRHFCVRLNA